MEKVLGAYSYEHIEQYLNNVKENGLTEHGFPRLTADIGILIAHGRCKSLVPIFLQMMDVCCDMFLRPYVKSANEFSVREIVCCINEVERAKAVEEVHIQRWKQKISMIVPNECYNLKVESEEDLITNWAIFGALSEYARYYFGLGNNTDFVDRQLSCQFKWLDENGMYKDNKREVCHQPILYDFVSRGLLSLLLHLGYRGKYFEKIDCALKKAGLLTLKMQSSSGEVPFGGRSNQFLHNEAWMIVIFEYEAHRYASLGNTELAGTFKAAVARALDVTERWLNKEPIRHIKNRFPTETGYGCEKYAYFDKYMITAASNLYIAYMICDESIPYSPKIDLAPEVFETSEYFHKLFVKCGTYGLEFDTNADPQHDAKGLGRIHKDNAPSAICMSCPCPPNPKYKTNRDGNFAFSMCSAVKSEDGYLHGYDESSSYKVKESNTHESVATATLSCTFENGKTVLEHYRVDEGGVLINVIGDGDIGYTLPAFYFDGENCTIISANEHSLSITYEGWCCRYVSSGKIIPLNKTAANRNGHYLAFMATGTDSVEVKIEITECSKSSANIDK